MSKSYRSSTYRRERIPALQDVSLRVEPGTTMVVVGESGSGKSSLCRLVLGLETPDGGSVRWRGRDVRKYRRRELYRQVQPVFQDSFNSLDPRWTIERSIAEPLRNYLRVDGQMTEEVRRLLDLVGLPDSLRAKYPHELSGGQQKRVCIARALSIRPQLMVLDEATSGLDGPLARRILATLRELRRQTSCSYLLVTHSIAVARCMADTIAVIRDGRILETVDHPQEEGAFEHPYSRALMRTYVQFTGVKGSGK